LTLVRKLMILGVGAALFVGGLLVKPRPARAQFICSGVPACILVDEPYGCCTSPPTSVYAYGERSDFTWGMCVKADFELCTQ